MAQSKNPLYAYFETKMVEDEDNPGQLRKVAICQVEIQMPDIRRPGQRIMKKCGKEIRMKDSNTTSAIGHLKLHPKEHLDYLTARDNLALEEAHDREATQAYEAQAKKTPKANARGKTRKALLNQFAIEGLTPIPEILP